MAPEYTPKIVIFDARFENGELKGSTQYIETEHASQQLRVRWDVESQPEDFRQIGGGIAYVYAKGPEVKEYPISRDARPTVISSDRYRWAEGMPSGCPWLMFIMILPEKHTLFEPNPKPAHMKIFGKRLALFWMLKGDDLGRTEVECTIREYEGDLGQELVRVNRDYLPSSVPTPSTIAVDITHILFLSDNPTDQARLRVEQESREIQEKLQLAKYRERFKFHIRMAVRPADISQAMLDILPQIVHFAGHGMPTGELCFEDETGRTHPVSPDALAELFEQFADQVSCVILNACYSEAQAKAIAKHIEHVVGVSQGIPDRAAIAFAVGFYQAVGAGYPIEKAYELGHAQVRLWGIPEYLTPVLVKKGQVQS